VPLSHRFAWLLLACSLTSSAAADDFFEGLSPGLVGQYTAGEVRRARVDGDVAFDWSAAPPFPEFPRGPFSVEWNGTLFVRSDTNYTFSADADGAVKIVVDGRTVLDSSGDSAGWRSGPATALEFGFLPITVTFTKPAEQERARCRLFWSSDQFPVEPLPHHLLFHEADDAQARLVERGRQLFDAHRCNRCHGRGDCLPSAEAPPFIAVAADLNPDWIVAKLQHKHPEAADSKMPVFGYSPEQAKAIGAWLWHINQPPRIAPFRPAEGKPKDLPSGLTLIRSVGCLACHKVGELGSSGPFGGGDLSHIGAKRTVDWLYTWLSTPDRINPERTMPVIKLSPAERSLIAAELAKLGYKEEMSFERPKFEDNTQLVQQGRELVKQARCFNCHKTPAVEVDTRGLSKLDRLVADALSTGGHCGAAGVCRDPDGRAASGARPARSGGTAGGVQPRPAGAGAAELPRVSRARWSEGHC
jgi:mono/diheme cytochrome c family protein